MSQPDPLYARLEEVLGSEHARTLMKRLPPQPAVELATKSDVAMLTARFDGLEGRFDGLERRFDGLEGRFDGLDRRFERLEDRFDHLDKSMHRMYESMQNQLKTYSMITVAAMTGLTAIYAGLLVAVV